MKRRNMTTKLATFMLTFAVAFTAFPAMSVPFESHAASPYWKNYKVVSTFGHAQIVWKELTKKQQKKISGIAIYRNGKKIATTTKDDVFYYDAKSKVGKTYTYQIKTYKKTRKTVRMYYNKKTRKWQTRKIKGANTKKVRRNVYKYANASAKKKITVRKETKEDSEKPAKEDTEPESWAAVDFRGEKWVITVDEDGWLVGKDKNSGTLITSKNDLARFDRSIDGEFSTANITRWETYVQINGVTFNKTCWEKERRFVAYNVDPAKMSRVDEFPNNDVMIQEVDTYNYKLEPIKIKYLIKNGKRLAVYNPEWLKEQRIGEDGTVSMEYESLRNANGYCSTHIRNKCLYDGKVIFEKTRLYPSDADESGLDTNARTALDIAHKAVAANGGKKSYNEDMRAIERYVRANYTYAEPLGKSSLLATCSGGMYILSTYSELEYGVYGFAGPGSAKPGKPNYGWHEAFHLESDPNKYYQTQGHD